MKKTIVLSAATLLLTFSSFAQPVTKTLKKVLELKMPKTVDDDMPGTRGASVAWHPVQKKYYAAFAGNMGYPLAVFDEKGKRLSEDDLTTQFDIRGMWYNPVSKTIQMNGYAESGWAEYKLNSKGIPTETGTLFEGQNQPGAQSTGLYNAREKKVYFFNNEDGSLTKYTLATGEEEEETVTLHLGKTKESADFENEDVAEEYNGAAVYTDIPGSEIALLNHYNKTIELYSLRTGYKVKEFKLPEDAVVETTFNFAYSNSTYWLFNMEQRIWKGYK